MIMSRGSSPNLSSNSMPVPPISLDAIRTSAPSELNAASACSLVWPDPVYIRAILRSGANRRMAASTAAEVGSTVSPRAFVSETNPT